MLNTFKSRFLLGKAFQRQLLLFFIIIITPIIFSISGCKGCDCNKPDPTGGACKNATVGQPTKNGCVYSFTLNVTGVPTCDKKFKIAVTSGNISTGDAMPPQGWSQTEGSNSYLVWTPIGGGSIPQGQHTFQVTLSGAASTSFSTYLIDEASASSPCTTGSHPGTCP